MLEDAESCASQGTYSVWRKKSKSKLYFSSKKELEKSRMRITNKEFNFRGPSKLLDFGNVDVVDIVGVIDRVLQAIQEVEELMTTYTNKTKCATKKNVSPAPP